MLNRYTVTRSTDTAVLAVDQDGSLRVEYIGRDGQPWIAHFDRDHAASALALFNTYA